MAAGQTGTHHDAFGLFVGGLLHQAGQLTEVSLVLLQQTWRRVAEHIHINAALNTDF